MPCSSDGLVLARVANRLLSASRACTRVKRLGIDDGRHGDLSPLLLRPVHGFQPLRGVARPCRRATRFRPGCSWIAMVLPNTARPA